MHARLVMFALGPGTRQIHDRLVEQFAPALRSIRGFRAVTFGADYEAGEYLSLTCGTARPTPTHPRRRCGRRWKRRSAAS
jgi:hypothetical protein